MSQSPDIEASLVNNEVIGWSKTDSFSQVFGKEHSGRVRGVGPGPLPSQDSVNVSHGLQGLHTTSDPNYNSQDVEMQKMRDRTALMEATIQQLVTNQNVGISEPSVGIIPSNMNAQSSNGSRATQDEPTPPAQGR